MSGCSHPVCHSGCVRGGQYIQFEAGIPATQRPVGIAADPQAGLRAATILVPLLHQSGILNLALYPASLNRDSLLAGNEQAAAEDAKRWAREQGFNYAVTGNVDEWRYKVGVDGEPAVGISLLVWDLGSDRIVWSAVSGKSGYSREAVSAVAQKMIRDLTARMPLTDELK